MTCWFPTIALVVIAWEGENTAFQPSAAFGLLMLPSPIFLLDSYNKTYHDNFKWKVFWPTVALRKKKSHVACWVSGRLNKC